MDIEKLKKRLYVFKHGHPFLLDEEVDIICETRSNEKLFWMNDRQIQQLVKLKIKCMYRGKYPDAKKWQLSNLFNNPI